MAMNRRIEVGFLVMVLVCVAVFLGAWRYSEVQDAKRRVNHERCAAEAEMMVAEFLRTDGQPSFGGNGDFVRLTGSGVSSSRGYAYLARKAHFTNSTVDLQIVVMRGE